MSKEFDHIVCTNNVLFGSPRISGRRLAVSDVVSLVSCYGTFEEVQNDFELTLEEIEQALKYCSSLQCRIDDIERFCHSCSLRREAEGPLDITGTEEISIGTGKYVKGEDHIFMGSLQEMLTQWQGKDWWLIAADLLIEHKNKFSRR